jgi:acyl-coenzyme A synthetase/AMP-(fatty) acid ligase
MTDTPPGASHRSLAPRTPGTPPGRRKLTLVGYADRAASTVVRDGAEYVVTADYGYLDGDGQLFLTARSDQTGAGTGPVDVIGVEGALRDLDGVADAVLASTSDGSVAGLTAALLPTPANGVQPDAVLERAERLLARLLGDLRGRPAAVVVARIPYSPTGKVDLPVLVSMVKEQK